MTRYLLLLALAGCPSKAPKDPAYTPAGPKPCEKMADHVVGLLYKDPITGKQTDKYRDTSDTLTRMLIETCTKDKWTQDAQQCWLQVTSSQEIEKCSPLMTIEQRDNLVKAIDVAFPRESEPAKPEPAGSGSAAP
jgi:hypothetical protein